jgi:hypothetical protein
MFKHTPLPLYFFLAAFIGFAFVLVFSTIPNINYVLLIYKFAELVRLIVQNKNQPTLAASN